MALSKSYWESQEKEEELIKNVCLFFFLVTPHTDALEIYETWHIHSVLKDYTKPDFNKLKEWVEEFENELLFTNQTK